MKTRKIENILMNYQLSASSRLYSLWRLPYSHACLFIKERHWVIHSLERNYELITKFSIIQSRIVLFSYVLIHMRMVCLSLDLINNFSGFAFRTRLMWAKCIGVRVDEWICGIWSPCTIDPIFNKLYRETLPECGELNFRLWVMALVEYQSAEILRDWVNQIKM